MSAYICDPSVFGILAAYAVENRCVIPEWRHGKRSDSRIQTAEQVARGLARENIRSVITRYPNSQDGNRPGSPLLDADIETAAAIYARYFIEHPQKLTAAQVIRLCGCLDYQSCETDDWEETLAYQQLQRIGSTVMPGPAGYDIGRWAFTQPIPEIEALYARGAA